MRTLTLFSLCAAIVLGLFFFTNKGGTDKDYSLFGIPLVPPAFAQGTPASFPDPEAGLSSYIQRDPGLINFATIIPIFDETVQSGENYIIGAFNIARTEETSPLEDTIHVRVYVDKNGFVVAYLTKDKLATDMFRWYLSDPPEDPLDTVLSDVLAMVTAAIGAPAPTDASWYHWSYPSATHFSAAAKKGVGNMYMQIPDEALFSENPSYSWYSKKETLAGKSGFLILRNVSGTETVLEFTETFTDFVRQELAAIAPGERYTFELGNGSGGVGNNFLGVAVVYQIP